MSSLLHQTSQTPISISTRRFISTLCVLKNPIISQSKHIENLTFSNNPNHFSSHHTRNTKPTIIETKIFHAQITKTSLLQSNIFFANYLADLYCKSSAVNEALLVLDEMPHPNLISWNLIISGYNRNLQFEDSLRIFCKIRSFGLEPNQFTYGSILSACASSQDLRFGNQVYALVIKNGFFSDGYVCTGMIDLFAKSSCFEDALTAFSNVSSGNVVCWNAIIAGCVRNGESWVALDLFRQMLDGFSMPNGFTFPSILTACAAVGELHMGRGIHGLVIKCGVEHDIFVGTAIVDLYAKCGDMDEAVTEFSLMPIRNVVSWTAIISGFVQKDESVYALQFFKQMREMGVDINNYTVTSVLTACAKPKMATVGVQIHNWIIKMGCLTDTTIKDALINLYAKIGEIGLSEKVFDEMGSLAKVSTWAAMLSGFAQNQSWRRSIEFFRRMFLEGLKPDKFCSSSVLSIIRCIDLGNQIHSYIVKSGLVVDVSVASALFTMYSKCGSLEGAYEVFKRIPKKDGVSWTSMIAGFAENGCADQAFQLFRDMICNKIQPDPVTLSAVLTACSSYQSLKKGRETHGYAFRVGLETDILVTSSLVTMYSKCKTLASARRVFDEMPRKDQVSCSSLVSGYARNGYTIEALSLFHQMAIDGLEIDCFMISAVLGISATLTKPGLGKQLHAHASKTGLDIDLSVSSSLVTMYSKFGSIDDARKIFNQINNPDLISWSAMITGYAQHGHGMEALKIYEMMKEQGTKPDSVTFVGVLSACSHNGLVEEGYFYLNSMTKDYGIAPEACHYACMVDLLSRLGRLEEASVFIDAMPIEPNALVWGTLLGACRVHGNVSLGKLAAKKVLELEPCDAGAYVLLSNICADAGEWEEVSKIRNLMKGIGAKKEPGWSFV